MEEEDDESIASADPTADAESQDLAMDEDTEVKVNGVIHADG